MGLTPWRFIHFLVIGAPRWVPLLLLIPVTGVNFGNSRVFGALEFSSYWEMLLIVTAALVSMIMQGLLIRYIERHRVSGVPRRGFTLRLMPGMRGIAGE